MARRGDFQLQMQDSFFLVDDCDEDSPQSPHPHHFHTQPQTQTQTQTQTHAPTHSQTQAKTDRQAVAGESHTDKLAEKLQKRREESAHPHHHNHSHSRTHSRNNSNSDRDSLDSIAGSAREGERGRVQHQHQHQHAHHSRSPSPAVHAKLSGTPPVGQSSRTPPVGHSNRTPSPATGPVYNQQASTSSRNPSPAQLGQVGHHSRGATPTHEVQQIPHAQAGVPGQPMQHAPYPQHFQQQTTRGGSSHGSPTNLVQRVELVEAVRPQPVYQTAPQPQYVQQYEYAQQQQQQQQPQYVIHNGETYVVQQHQQQHQHQHQQQHQQQQQQQHQQHQQPSTNVVQQHQHQHQQPSHNSTNVVRVQGPPPPPPPLPPAQPKPFVYRQQQQSSPAPGIVQPKGLPSNQNVLASMTQNELNELHAMGKGFLKLCEMGFSAQASRIALKVMKGNLEAAIDFCFEYTDEDFIRMLGEDRRGGIRMGANGRPEVPPPLSKPVVQQHETFREPYNQEREAMNAFMENRDSNLEFTHQQPQQYNSTQQQRPVAPPQQQGAPHQQYQQNQQTQAPYVPSHGQQATAAQQIHLRQSQDVTQGHRHQTQHQVAPTAQRMVQVQPPQTQYQQQQHQQQQSAPPQNAGQNQTYHYPTQVSSAASGLPPRPNSRDPSPSGSSGKRLILDPQSIVHATQAMSQTGHKYNESPHPSNVPSPASMVNPPPQRVALAMLRAPSDKSVITEDELITNFDDILR